MIEDLLSFSYNSSGLRVKKDNISNPNQSVEYVLDGDKIIVEYRGNDVIYYTYDVDGSLLSMNYNGSEYFYITDLLGNVIEMVDTNGNTVVEYKYDAWGNIVYQTPNSNIGDINPFRYRSYYLDTETGYYYLQSRYYNPEIGRFINSDGLLGEEGDVLQHNSYSYCTNNPIMFTDLTGFAPEWLVKATKIATIALATVVVGILVVSTAGTAAPILIGAIAGASSQMVSNVVNDKNIGENILGAAVGGAMVGAGAGAFTSGFVNAGINEIENSIRENRVINPGKIIYEGIGYGVLNKIAPTLKNEGMDRLLFNGLVNFEIDSFGFTGMTHFQDSIFSKLDESIRETLLKNGQFELYSFYGYLSNVHY